MGTVNSKRNLQQKGKENASIMKENITRGIHVIGTCSCCINLYPISFTQDLLPRRTWVVYERVLTKYGTWFATLIMIGKIILNVNFVNYILHSLSHLGYDRCVSTCTYFKFNKKRHNTLYLTDFNMVYNFSLITLLRVPLTWYLHQYIIAEFSMCLI